MVREPDTQQQTHNNVTSVKWTAGDRYRLISEPLENNPGQFLVQVQKRGDASEQWETLQWWHADERPKVDET